jgi:hypothetical protein
MVAHADVSGAAAPRAVRFLGADPVGPLAEGRGTTIATPATTACRAWGPVGSRWVELDAYGRAAGHAVVRRREYYEVSHCDELRMRRVDGTPGAGVFVDAAAGYKAPRVTSWRPGGRDLAALETTVSPRQLAVADLDPAHPVPFERRVLFFEWQPSAERYAVVGGRSLVVLAFRGGRWDVLHEQKPKTMRGRNDAYSPLLVTDMNGDGLPEIVVHSREAQGEWFGDFTLSLDVAGSWRRIDAGIFGSTG